MALPPLADWADFFIAEVGAFGGAALPFADLGGLHLGHGGRSPEPCGGVLNAWVLLVEIRP